MAGGAVCEFCAKEDGNYHFGRVCCRARYITGLPLKRLRTGWMERWRVMLPGALYAEIEEAVKARWERTKGAVSGK